MKQLSLLCCVLVLLLGVACQNLDNADQNWEIKLQEDNDFQSLVDLHKNFSVESRKHLSTIAKEVYEEKRGTLSELVDPILEELLKISEECNCNHSVSELIVENTSYLREKGYDAKVIEALEKDYTYVDQYQKNTVLLEKKLLEKYTQLDRKNLNTFVFEQNKPH